MSRDRSVVPFIDLNLLVAGRDVPYRNGYTALST